MLFAPAVTSDGAVFAAVPDHHAQMMEAGHCKSLPSPDEDNKAPAKSCCIAMCMAVAIAPSAPMPEPSIEHSSPSPALASVYLGYLGEIATPPPRLA